jgi:hypothetical protein
MIREHIIVIRVANGGNPSPHLFPCRSEPTTEANKANEADVADYLDETVVVDATGATKADETDVADKP